MPWVTAYDGQQHWANDSGGTYPVGSTAMFIKDGTPLDGASIDANKLQPSIDQAGTVPPGYHVPSAQENSVLQSYAAANTAKNSSEGLGGLVLPALMAGVGGLAFSGAGIGGAASGTGTTSAGTTLGNTLSAAPSAGGSGMFDFADPSTWGDFSSTPVPNDPTYLSQNWGIDPTTGASNFGSSVAGDTPVGGNVASSIFGPAGSLPPGLSSLAQMLGLGGNGSSGSSNDLLSMLGRAAPGLLGALGANSQANTLQNIANQARSDRAPFLGLATGLAQGGPAAYAAGPGASALKGVLQGLSVQGNPLGSGTSMQLATDAAGANWQNAVTGFGNLGLGGQATQIQAATNAAGAQGNVLNSLGAAAGDVFNPQTSLASLLKTLGGSGANLNTGTGVA